MTVEKRFVLVGIRIDSQSRQLLNWALVKVAEPGDCVVAVHVVKTKSSDDVLKIKSIIDGYLEVYEGLCDVKKVGLSAKILTGRSIRNILVREAKDHGALALVVGGKSATAKYCAKQLPLTINVLAVQDSRIVFGRCNNKLPRGSFILDPRPSIDYPGDGIIQSEKHKSRSISMFAGDPSEQKLGWPLLCRTHSEISQSCHERDMSVVQWVMTLPDRSSENSPQSTSSDENPFERSTSDILEDESIKNYLSPSVVLPKGLEEILNVNSLNCKWFSLEALKYCTSQFSSENLIGKGGSNRVYKGVLSDGKPIAIKVLRQSKEAWKDFAFEMEIISPLKHKNISQLLGICIEDNNTLISVYDYYPKGSLEENLHGKNKDGSILSWEVRFNVAVGIAEALDYLHTETLKPVIHRDVKSSNILLSQDFEPQLSDFGLAIWGPTKTPFLTQEDVVGTFGYLAPEYFMYGKVSDKIDVYAFGVVLLELISGREPISSEPCKGQESLVVWAKPLIENGDVKGLLDPKLEGKCDETQLQRMVLAASLCITQAARLRPKFNQILKILKEGDEVEHCFNEQSENEENIDDEVYPHSSAELHLTLALLGVDEDSTSSCSSTDHRYSENLKDQWSRSSSFN
ncbi:protein kinase STUNTED-like [Vicia villosa]|uniref:protein kinase STUNTED-like n=1 Tax=Vicia villosa TaxID=3911 RepID=UPI00273B0C1C|nr:protein kinase STUNTED-like [Vicia villosa]XP_058759116.1 protein kinase STUNTED-like [Vicia villosa]